MNREDLDRNNVGLGVDQVRRKISINFLICCCRHDGFKLQVFNARALVIIILRQRELQVWRFGEKLVVKENRE